MMEEFTQTPMHVRDTPVALGYKTFWAISILILCLFLCGCSTYRPYTAREKTLMGAAITAQAIDVATTSYALSQPGFSEGNNIWWGNDTGSVLSGMLATKAAICGVAYLAGQAWPDSRTWIWSTAAVIGGGAAVWNAYQIIENQ